MLCFGTFGETRTERECVYSIDFLELVTLKLSLFRLCFSYSYAYMPYSTLLRVSAIYLLEFSVF